MLVVTRASPEVANLLGLNVLGLKRRAVQRRCGDLEDRQRGDKTIERLSDSRNRGDERRQAELLLLKGLGRAGRAGRHMSDERAQKSGSEGQRLHHLG